MRLLPKKDISIAQAERKRAEIDEGVKLARRIDSLREIAANEEASLANFRATSIKNIYADIQKVEAERNSLLTQVQEIREEIARGTAKLDVRAQELDKKEAEIEEKRLKLVNLIDTFREFSQALQNQASITASNTKKTVSTLELIDSVRKETAENLKSSQNYLQGIKDMYTSYVETKYLFERELMIRDTKIASQERDLIIKEKHLDQIAEALRIKELQLIDREQTLEREFKRLKK